MGDVVGDRRRGPVVGRRPDRLPSSDARVGGVEDLRSDERRDLHLRLARSNDDPLERGHHLTRSVHEPDERVALSLDLAADEAVRLGDHAVAAEFLLHAVKLAPEHAQMRERQVRAASELELAGDVNGASDLATDLVSQLGRIYGPRSPDPVSSSLGSDLSYDDALTELDMALDDASGDDVLSAELHLAMGEIGSGTCRLTASLADLRTAIECAERAGATDLRVAALSEYGFTECMLGRGISENAERAFESWDGSIVSTTGYSPRMAIACEMIHATRFDEAQELFLQEIALAEELGLEPIEVTAERTWPRRSYAPATGLRPSRTVAPRCAMPSKPLTRRSPPRRPTGWR